MTASNILLAGIGPGAKPWIFLDEIRVDGVVPEPGPFALLATGIVVIGPLRTRRNTSTG